MRIITNTHTGNIISDDELKLEYLFVGDYGKQNNIKADFLGYTNKIKQVKHEPVNIKEKLVVTISSQKGCPMNCNFCDCPKFGFYGNCSEMEMLSEITTAISLSGIQHGKRLNVHFARMGEPTFNPDVIKVAKDLSFISSSYFDVYHPVLTTMMPKSNKNLEKNLLNWIETGFKYGDDDGFGVQFSINTLDNNKRNAMFRNYSLNLKEIKEIISNLPYPKNRKYTLNFAVSPDSNLNPELMDYYFDKNKCIVKITPIHKTFEAIETGYKSIDNFDVYTKFEQPLLDSGWDVIVFIPSKEEDADRITCGNALISRR